MRCRSSSGTVDCCANDLSDVGIDRVDPTDSTGDGGDAVDGPGGVGLNTANPGADIAGCGTGLLSEVLDFTGDDGETLSGLTGPGCLDCRVQRQQVRLLSD